MYTLGARDLTIDNMEENHRTGESLLMNAKVERSQQVINGSHSSLRFEDDRRELNFPGSKRSRSSESIVMSSQNPRKQRRLEEEQRDAPQETDASAREIALWNNLSGAEKSEVEVRATDFSALFAEHDELTPRENHLTCFALLEQIKVLLIESSEHDVELAFAVLCWTADIEVKVICLDVLLKAVASMKYCYMLLPVLSHAMRHYPQSESVQLGALRLIHGHTAQTIGNQQDKPFSDKECLLQLELGNAVVETITRFSDSATVQGVCLDILRHFTLSTDCTSLGHDFWVSAIPAISLAVSRYLNVSLIQLPGLALTAWLSEEEVYRNMLWNSRTDENGIVDTIRSAMKIHPADTVIQCNAAASLCWLLHNLGSSITGFSTGNYPRILPVVLEALRRHCDDAAVFGNCVCLLTAMPVSDDTNRNTTEVELDATVAKGMRQHISSCKVQACCLRWMLHYMPNEMRRLVPFIPAVLECMNQHTCNEYLQSQACGILSALADHDVDQVLKHGCVDAVLAALQHHPSNDKVQLEAGWFMIAAATATVPATRAFGGGIAVVAAIWRGLGASVQLEILDDAQEEEDDETL